MAALGGGDGVTRDALRAELATLELRLIGKLASAERVSSLEQRVLSQDAVKEIIAQALRDTEARGWTGRERVMGVVLFLITLGSFALNLFALNGGK